MDEIADALAQFLYRAEELGQGTRPGFADVAFPAGTGPSIGSPIGREVWASDEAQRLTAALLRHPSLLAWAQPPPAIEFNELRRAVAMFTDAWSQTNDTPEEFVSGQADAMMKWLTSPNPVCHGLLIIQGVAIPKQVILLEGLQLLPTSPENIHALTEQLPIARARKFFACPIAPQYLAFAQFGATERNGMLWQRFRH